MDFGKADFPRQAGMAQARARRGPGTAVVAADDDRVGLGLDDAGSDGADTGAGRQFYADGSPAIGIFKSKMSSAKSSME